MTGIFISYRRSDSQASVARLFDDLLGVFWPQHIFCDVRSIESGEQYPQVLRERLIRSAVVICVIGPEWSSARTDERLRLYDPADWVRRELLDARVRQLPVIPVLVDGALPPQAAELPAEIQWLTALPHFELTSRSWRSSFGLLARRIVETSSLPTRQRFDRVLRWGRAAVVLVAIVAVSSWVAARSGVTMRAPGNMYVVGQIVLMQPPETLSNASLAHHVRVAISMRDVELLEALSKHPRVSLLFGRTLRAKELSQFIQESVAQAPNEKWAPVLEQLHSMGWTSVENAAPAGASQR